MNAFESLAQSLAARATVNFSRPNNTGGVKPGIKQGQVFGRWTVIGYVPGNRTDGANVRPRYTCRCECGTVRNVFGSALKRGMSKSCGCLTGRSRIPAGRSA